MVRAPTRSGPPAATGPRRRARLLAALVVASALVAASWVHPPHDHPHRPGQELSCAVCSTPLGGAATAPTLTPPTARRDDAVAVPVVAAPARIAPLAFSPKQSPPAFA